MGRGAMAIDYEGNLRLRGMVANRREDYSDALRRIDKHRIADEIVQAVLDKGGDDSWKVSTTSPESKP